MMGPQADFWYPVDAKSKSYSGQLYSQNNSRGIIAWRGQVVQSFAAKIPRLTGTIGDREARRLRKRRRVERVHDYRSWTSNGAYFEWATDGVLIDDDPASSNNISGLIGLQVEGVPCKVSFRNLWLKKLS